MERPGLRAFVLAVGIIFIMLNAGCEEGQVPSEKKARVIAAENMQLKRQLQKYEKKLEQQKELLAECQEEKESLGGESGGQMDEFFNSLVEENEKLLAENENLKLQIEKLKKELEEIKKLTEQPTKSL